MPGRRLLAALAVAAVASAPALAAAQTRRGGTSVTTGTATGLAAPGALSVGGFIGLESGDADGFTLRLDGEWPLQALSDRLGFSVVGSVGWFNASEDVIFGEATQNIFKLVPAVRFTFPISPELAVYGDAGLGLYHARVTVEQNIPTEGRFEEDATDTALMLRFGAGGFFRLNEQLRVGGELGFNPYLGDVDDTTFTIMVGLMYQL